MKETLDERFWPKVDRGDDGCWQWIGSNNGRGYGQIYFDQRRGLVPAHRVSLMLRDGEWPDGLVDHTCHNRGCVNPDHLRVVSASQNQQNLKGPRAGTRSGVRGVVWSKSSKKWRVQVKSGGKYFHGGVYSDLAEAERAAIALRCRLMTHNDMDRGAVA